MFVYMHRAAEGRLWSPSHELLCIFVAVFSSPDVTPPTPTALQPAARDQRDPVTSDLSWAEPQPQAPGCMSQTGCDAWNGG